MFLSDVGIRSILLNLFIAFLSLFLFYRELKAKNKEDESTSDS